MFPILKQTAQEGTLGFSRGKLSTIEPYQFSQSQLYGLLHNPGGANSVQFVLIDIAVDPVNIRVLKDNVDIEHALVGTSTSFVRFKQEDKTYCKVTCTFPITEYFAFGLNVESQKLVVHVFTIDKDHNVEHYILNPSIFSDSNLHLKSVINYNNNLGIMKVLAIKKNGDDYQFLVHTGDKDTAINFYGGSKVETKLACNTKLAKDTYNFLLLKTGTETGELCYNDTVLSQNDAVEGNGIMPLNTYASSGIRVFTHDRFQRAIRPIFANYHTRVPYDPTFMLDIVELDKSVFAAKNFSMVLKIGCDVKDIDILISSNKNPSFLRRLRDVQFDPQAFDDKYLKSTNLPGSVTTVPIFVPPGSFGGTYVIHVKATLANDDPNLARVK